MQNIIISLSVVLASFISAVSATVPAAPIFIDGSDPKPDGMKWNYIPEFSDEFNEPKLDETKWTRDPVSYGWNWLGRNPGLFEADNVYVKDGNLVIKVEKFPEPKFVNSYGKLTKFEYGSGILRMLKPAHVGLYYECRLRMSKTEMGGGFWLMTRDHPDRRHEIDIQECVGVMSPNAHNWAKSWDRIMHSNAIHRTSKNNLKEKRDQKCVHFSEKNSDRFFVYGAWWKSPREILFYLDGKYVYTLVPPVNFDLPSHIQLSVEYYDWNPIPDKKSVIEKTSLADREAKYDWVRTWRLESK